MDLTTLLIILAIGAIAGWLAGILFKGSGFGLPGDIIIGILGGFLGGWLLPRLGVHIGTGYGGLILTATLGALVLLFVISLIRKA